jgi:hypothetical protein
MTLRRCFVKLAFEEMRFAHQAQRRTRSLAGAQPQRGLGMLLLSIQENPGYPHSYRVLAACYAHMRRLDEARAIIARLRSITPRLVPSAAQLRRPADRELFLSGLNVPVGEAN